MKSMFVATAMALSVGACSSSSTPDCDIEFTGNHTADVTSDKSCGDLGVVAGSTDVVWSLDASANMGQDIQLAISVDLGSATPTAGTFSSETVTNWQAIGTVASTNCVYSAGDQAIPSGDFTLTITDIIVGAGGAATSSHGTFHADQYVQAPVGVDCGAGDTQTIDITF